jgi:uncharacterized protein DUF5683
MLRLRKLLSTLPFCFLVMSLFFVLVQPCAAQDAPDSVQNKVIRDTAAPLQQKTHLATSNESHASPPSTEDSLAFALRPHPYQPNPKKSGLYSAILPGLGQAYNHQYWKVPVVYVGLAIAGYFINDNLTKYNLYRKAYISRINNPNFIDQFTAQNLNATQLQQYENDYSKYLDLTVLFTGVGYFMQVVDAITSAHLKNFDISRDISMHVAPVAFPNGVGMGLVMNLK